MSDEKPFNALAALNRVEAPNPTVRQLCLEVPLYHKVEPVSRAIMHALRAQSVQFDAYCIHCEKESTFRDIRNRGGGAGMAADPDWVMKPAFFQVDVRCQRNQTHHYLFEFSFADNVLIKFGQLPSLEDIAGADIRKYARLLSEGYFAELRRATGLASHGIGIGAFVYLRRIFEKLIETHREETEKQNGPINGFDSMSMQEKIGALKGVLPPALVENKAAYGILSVGIHELDEETCRKYFPAVRQAIITILEQDLRRRQQEEETKRLREEIARIAGEVKGGK